MFDPSLIHGTHWLADPVGIRLAIAKLKAFATCPTPREVVARKNERLEAARQLAAQAKPIRASKGKIGVIGIHGPIQQRMTAELDKIGGTSCEEVGVALDAMLADKSIESIVMHFDSPGGGVYGIQELSDRIFAARSQKRIYAHADSMACSAAYWLASAATPGCFIVTPSGDVGSVGVYSVHVDQSKALEAQGYTVTLAKAGRHKAEFMDIAPLTDEAKAFQQEMVDDTYRKFQAALKRNRGTTIEDVRANYGEGRTVNAEQALARKMVDRIMSYPDFIGKMTGDSSDARKAEVDCLRRAHERNRLLSQLLIAS